MIHIKKNHKKKKIEATSLELRATEDVSKNKDKKEDGIWYRLFGRFDYEKNKKDISQSQRGWEKLSWARDLKAVQPIKTMNEVTINFRKN